jgi:hypothetical protein
VAQQDFQPRFISQQELAAFGLPDATVQPDIITLVERASTLIDEACGRQDVDGNGSLVYTTYTERVLLPQGRNMTRLSFRPLVAVPLSVQQQLVASANQMDASGNPIANNFYTGFQPNTQNAPVASANLTPLISCSGRYGYGRRGQQQVYPDLNYAANVLQIASFFGGPPTFTPVDITQVDYDPRTGEIWVPAGLYLSQYTELVVAYNVGFHPLHMPRGIKHACASLVRNLLVRGGGATGLTGFGAGKIRADFTPALIDVTIEQMLMPYYTVRAL